MKNHSERAKSKTRIGRRVLLLIATVITALAVAVTCALCIDSSKRVAVDSAANGEAQTSATSATYSTVTAYNFTTATGTIGANKAGQLVNGDVLTFTGTNAYYTITLPRGKYTLSVWGAQGGTGQGSSTSSRPAGAYGGYATGTWEITATTVIYIYVGGKGGDAPANNSTGSYVSGGYNGGGRSGTNSYSYYKGAGGGGATHIATKSGLLSSLSSYKSNILIVAGGGGGAGYSSSYSQGKGGGSTGAANYPSGGSHNATGGTQTAGGTDKGTHGSRGGAGSFGQGGAGATASSKSGGGGGGGGYYGGAGGDSGNSSACGGGGGGSGYVGGVTSGSMSTGTRAGNGQAQITAVSVNQAPTSQNYNIPTVKPRGTSLGISVAASTLAKDTDYINISGGNQNNVYFTAGNASNYDTSPTDNNGLYLDAACTVNASKYMTYSWSGGTTTSRNTLTINSITKLPRANVDGQANNKFTLYTKVRDAFGGTTTASRGVGVAMFTLSVEDKPIEIKAAHNKTNVYKLGQSTKNTDAEKSLDYGFTNSEIYNPAGKNLTTLFIPKSISPNDTTGYTINASEIFSDADTAYDKVAFKSITVLSAYSSASPYYSLVLNPDTTNYATGLYPSFTVKATGVRPTGSPYVVMQILGQSSETSTKAAVGNTQTTALYLVFRISNTRPYLGSTASLTTKLPEQVISLTPGQSKTVNIKSFVYDMDDGATLKATLGRGANDLKVPTGEFIQVDMSNKEVALATNVGSNYAGKSGIATNSYLTGEGSVPTHFNQKSVAAYGSNAASTANVLYRYVDSQTIEFIGRTASQKQYRTDAGLIDSSRKGHFYVLVRLVDPSDANDNGIWMPIALEVTSQKPVEPTPYANVTLGFTGSTVDESSHILSQGTANSAYLTPLSYIDSNNVLQGIGKNDTENSNTGHVAPFVMDPDGFIYSGAAFERANALNDFVFINGGASAIHDEATQSFFTVEPATLYAAKSVFAMIPDNDLGNYGITVTSNQTMCSFTGLKITPIRSTNGEYYQFTVDVKDTHNQTASISICVKVDNRPVASRLDPESSGNYGINALLGRDEKTTPRGSYEVNENLGSNTKVVNYTLEVFDEVQITPYDFAYDYDIDPDLSKLNTTITGYNTNPLDSGFKTAANHILGTYNVVHTAEPATAKGTASAVKAQQLTFTFMASPTAQTAYETQYNSQYGNYINVTTSANTLVKKGDSVESFDIPCLRIKGTSRTTSAIVQIRFTITDGITSVDCFVTVTVLNAAPVLNTAENHPITDTDKVRLEDYYRLTAFTDTTDQIVPNVYSFTAPEVAYDKDGDIPTFVSGSAKVVAYEDGAYYEQVYCDSQGVYHGYTEGTAGVTPINLFDYVSAQITKNNTGSDVIRIQGLSSTELINLPIYVRFTMRDGYRAQPAEAQLGILIDVLNSKPRFVGDGLLKSTVDNADQYQWLIDYEVNSELAQSRYLFNSKELYDSNGLLTNTDSPIIIPEKNKVYLFDDYDSQQHVILNPSQFASRGQLVAQFDSRIIDSSNGDVTGSSWFTESDFQTNDYINSAVVYTPMYKETGSGTNAEKGYYDVNVRFFYKTSTGFKEYATTADITNCEYWAIEIIDKRLNGDRRPVQFALSVKDSHHGKTLYQDPHKEEEQKTKEVESELKVLNFFYNYRSPGILAMHTYYRTDGNNESKVLIAEAVGNTPARYLVDQSVVTVNDFDADTDNKTQNDLINEFDQTTTTAARKQEILGQIKFSDDFRYKYFERTYQDSNNTTSVTYKRFADGDKPFKYKPIEVNPNGTSGTVVPMSYIALPKAAGASTETGEHVTFANVGWGSTNDHSTLSGGNELLDGDYTLWSGQGNTTLGKIYKNMTISDGSATYPVTDNPYITVRYVAKTSTNNVNFNSDYINTQRFKLSASGAHTPFEATDYREDKYGFEFTKKQGGIRAPGLLTLTLALKTISAATSEGSPEGTVEMVDVEIKLLDSKPTISYRNYITEKGESTIGDTVSNISLHMTIGDTSDSVMTLESVGTNFNADNGAKGKIYYNDKDSTDSMKFYTASAFQGGLSRAEIKYLLKNSNEIARAAYYRVATADLIKGDGQTTSGSTEGEGQTTGGSTEGEVQKIDPYDNYDPNPNYSMFFDVSPSSGASTSLQFIPKAKTHPNISVNSAEAVAYRTKYNLELDTTTGSPYYGKTYYPFRVLFYDDCRGSALSEGYLHVAVIRVYIDNDEISVNTSAIGNETYSGTANTDAVYNSKPKYTLNLSKSSSFYIDVTSLFNDDDIVLTGSKTFATATDGAWLDLEAEEKYIKDYLVMPTENGVVKYVNLYKQANGNAVSDSLPFSINMGGDTGFTSLPHTTLIFKANCAFKDEINLGLEFADSNGAKAYIVFSFVYSNEAPTPNSSSFGGTNTLDITMSSGEKLYLYASDSTTFENDKNSGFSSYKTVGEKYSFPYNGTEQSAATMAEHFKFFSSRYGSAGYDGDSLVLASDDAPTTLRIVGVNHDSVSNRLLTVTRELPVAREDTTGNGHLRLAITAGGVVDLNIAITLADGKGATVVVNVRVSVQSTAPKLTTDTSKLTALGLTAVSGETNTYAMKLQYSEVAKEASKTISLANLMTDADYDDVNSLDVYTNMDNSKFSIENPVADTAVVSASVGTDGGKNVVVITATDFINQKESYAKITFRVVDAHGAVSDYIEIRVTIEPATVTTVVGNNRSLPVSIMSFAQHVDVQNAGEPQQVNIVENNNAKLFKDTDATAPSAAYDVAIYVLLKYNSETKTYTTEPYNDKNAGANILLYSRRGSQVQNNNSDPEAMYVSNFFELSVSEDGKTILFTPNSVTIRSGSTITAIPLYIVVSKRYSDGTTMGDVGAQMDVTVANSKLMATEGGADFTLNYGYPYEKGTTELRDSAFLSFTGSKGDSLTWKLYNLENQYLGLFYDYDMINYADGRESIKYIGYDYTVNEVGAAANDPVLRVDISGEGASQEVTITINRNVIPIQPTGKGLENKSTAIEVSIYAVDAVNNTQGVTKKDTDKVVVTKIIVNVCNDRPEIATTGIIGTCPHCGDTAVVQENARLARCSKCNETFKSLDPGRLGYTVSYSPEAGYVMRMSLAKDESREIRIADIIDDADINMDSYAMVESGGTNSLLAGNTPVASLRAGDENGAIAITYQSNSNDYKLSTLSYITFNGRSTLRGAQATCTVKFRDSYEGSNTSMLTIYITIGNIAPTVKPDAKTNITLMGLGADVKPESAADFAVTYSILDFITDANGDNFDASLEANKNKRPTYTYIDEIELYSVTDDSPANRPEIFGPNLMIKDIDPATGLEIEYMAYGTVCSVSWLDNDPTHQKFRIEPNPGIYGVQKLLITVYDSGCDDGLTANIVDGIAYRLALTITVANPLTGIEIETQDMVFGITRSIHVEELLGDENSKGYEITNIVEIDTNYLDIIPPTGSGVSTSADSISIGNWRIYAKVEDVTTSVRITFSAGDQTRELIMPIRIIANHKPVYKNNKTKYNYTTSTLDDKQARTIKIVPTDWFEDSDAEDIMTFITPIKSSQSVKVEAVRAEENGQSYILLKFNRRGESVITVTLHDLSNKTYTYEITVNCTDAPELSWWEDTVSLIEANWLWFWIIVAAILLLIILLIIIIVVVHKKRKMRREIEALLESETELEEEMMRLSSGAAYQSFGYLPPTQQTMMDPGMMLGGGASAPTPNSLQLNAGTGVPPAGTQQPTVNNIPNGTQAARPQAAPQQRPQQNVQTPPVSNDGFNPDDF